MGPNICAPLYTLMPCTWTIPLALNPCTFCCSILLDLPVRTDAASCFAQPATMVSLVSRRSSLSSALERTFQKAFIYEDALKQP
jgi:hypothetical protein